MGQEQLTKLVTVTIEGDIVRSLDNEKLVAISAAQIAIKITYLRA